MPLSTRWKWAASITPPHSRGVCPRRNAGRAAAAEGLLGSTGAHLPPQQPGISPEWLFEE